MTVQTPLRSSFFQLRDRVEQEIAKSLLLFGEKSKLRDACEYALLSGGKRLRPILVLMVAEALGNGLNVAPAAIAVEFLHTASLIADDLPCMDNDDERRDRPSLHKAFGESTALLVSYSLIFAGYEKLYENGEVMRASPAPFASFADEACCLSLKHASQSAGIKGATMGQFLDLYPPNQSIETVKEVLYKKTVTLFEISFVFGWLFGGGSPSEIERVKKGAYHFGMAFQIADDLGDLGQDEANRREINSARILGPERAEKMFAREVDLLKEEISALGLASPSFEKVIEMLQRRGR